MSVRMKLSHSKTASRRAHHHAGLPRLVEGTAGARRKHFVDPVTGMYRGKQILAIGTVVEEKPAKAKRSAAKKEKAPAAEKDGEEK
jgi:ribosomal protein L32